MCPHGGYAPGGIRQGVGALPLHDVLPISIEELKQHIYQSGFKADDGLRVQALELIWNGLLLFRENSKRRCLNQHFDVFAGEDASKVSIASA